MVFTARPDGGLEIVATEGDLRGLIRTIEAAISEGEAEMVMLEEEGVSSLTVECIVAEG